MPDDQPAAERLATAETPRGELVLRRRGAVLELISNGTFLMDTSSGASEREMARVALDGLPAPARVLVGGMGFGFTLAEVLRFPVGAVVLVELEPQVLAWNRDWWPPGAAALGDPRLTVVVDDIGHYLATTPERFDAVLLDADNGPDWTVTGANSELYDEAGLGRLRRVLAGPGGRACVWSASVADQFANRLGRHFARVERHEVPVQRGDPDLLYVAVV
jgi:spermidine synthase